MLCGATPTAGLSASRRRGRYQRAVARVLLRVREAERALHAHHKAQRMAGADDGSKRLRGRTANDLGMAGYTPTGGRVCSVNGMGYTTMHALLNKWQLGWLCNRANTRSWTDHFYAGNPGGEGGRDKCGDVLLLHGFGFGR